MSSRTADGLLSPDGAVLTDPADVERALVKMWTPAGEQAAGKPAAKTATRVSVANLIVAAPAGQWDELLEVMAELSPIMPTRTIVLLIADGPEAPAEITASVSALCHVPQDGEAQVCCEQIVLRAGARHVEVLDETLLALLESDVPVMCWWRFDADAWPVLFSAIQSIARRIILDGLTILQAYVESSKDCAVRDLGWYRTARLREIVAQMFDGCRPEVAQSIRRVDIDAGGTLAGETDGLWLAAFLAGQLGWQPSALAAIREPGGSKCGGSFRFLANDGAIDVCLTTRPDGGRRLERVNITAGEHTCHFEQAAAGGNEYRITICGRGVCAAPRSVQLPPVRTSHALAAALAGRCVDAAFERAWPIAAWMAGAASIL
jgi:glucose-6-phosphate dehydrogenase assembly protein OpcA